MGSFNELMKYISGTKLGGVLPLDLTLHFFIGMIWTVFCLKKEVSFKKVLIGLILIAVLKEAYDYFFHYQSHWTEYASDFGITILYIMVLLLTRKAKSKLDGPGAPEKWKLYD